MQSVTHSFGNSSKTKNGLNLSDLCVWLLKHEYLLYVTHRVFYSVTSYITYLCISLQHRFTIIWSFSRHVISHLDLIFSRILKVACMIIYNHKNFDTIINTAVHILRQQLLVQHQFSWQLQWVYLDRQSRETGLVVVTIKMSIPCYPHSVADTLIFFYKIMYTKNKK